MKMIRLLLVQKDVEQKTIDTSFSGETELLEAQGSYQRWTNIGCSKHSERCLSHFSSWSPFSSVVVGGTTSIWSNSFHFFISSPLKHQHHQPIKGLKPTTQPTLPTGTPHKIPHQSSLKPSECIPYWGLTERGCFLKNMLAGMLITNNANIFSSRCWVYSFFGEDVPFILRFEKNGPFSFRWWQRCKKIHSLRLR